MASNPIAIIGAKGFLGQNLVQAFSSRCEVIQLSRIEAIEKISMSSVSAVINCSAVTDHHVAQTEPELTQEVNVNFPIALAKICQQTEAPLYQLSTDGLFSNADPRPAPRYWRLEDRVAPESEYGISKQRMEEGLKQVGWGHCMRLSFVGDDQKTGKGLVAFLAKSVAANKPITGFSDVWFTPLHVGTLAQWLWEEIVQNKGGFSCTQWASFPAMTKYEFLSEVCRRAGISRDVLAQLRQEMFPNLPAPLDQSLSASEGHLQTKDDVLKWCAQDLQILLKRTVP